MALIKCKEYGKEINKSAKTRPHCGYDKNEQNYIKLKFILKYLIE